MIYNNFYVNRDELWMGILASEVFMIQSYQNILKVYTIENIWQIYDSTDKTQLVLVINMSEKSYKNKL